MCRSVQGIIIWTVAIFMSAHLSQGWAEETPIEPSKSFVMAEAVVKGGAAAADELDLATVLIVDADDSGKISFLKLENQTGYMGEPRNGNRFTIDFHRLQRLFDFEGQERTGNRVVIDAFTFSPPLTIPFEVDGSFERKPYEIEGEIDIESDDGSLKQVLAHEYVEFFLVFLDEKKYRKAYRKKYGKKATSFDLDALDEGALPEISYAHSLPGLMRCSNRALTPTQTMHQLCYKRTVEVFLPETLEGKRKGKLTVIFGTRHREGRDLIALWKGISLEKLREADYIHLGADNRNLNIGFFFAP